MDIMGKRKKHMNAFMKNYGVTILAAFIPIIISFIGNWYMIKNSVSDLKSGMMNVDVSLDELKISSTKNSSDIENLKENIEDMESDLEKDISKIEDKVNTFDDRVYKIIPTDAILDRISVFNLMDNVPLSSSPSWNSSDVIAKNDKTNTDLTAKDLAESKLLIPYQKNGKEIYFLGQYDKNNQWHGKCIINVYENNRLSLITEANYEHGELNKYQQVYKSGNRVYVSNRTHKNNINTGETYSYLYTSDTSKKFTISSVTKKDILNIKKFKKNFLASNIDGFYKGNTKNGKYNDQTGQAYLVKYNKEGKIRLIYYGNFKNGNQEDSSGNAWDIVLGKDGKYYYREACYSENRINYKTMTYHKDALSAKKAENKLKEKLKEEFKNLKTKCALTWNNL